ncbi:glutamate--tRNA ligase family protein, partial [Pseudomonas syringae pv. tagetis]
EQKEAFRAEGRKPVLRLRMPDEDITFTDLVRGEITFKAGSVPDFVVARANGQPLYTLVNPVDDALMGITHVLRGEDLLSST